MANVYIDGESHYIRSEQFWQARHGERATLEMAEHRGAPKAIVHERKAKLFWDQLLTPNTERLGINSKFTKFTYFTSFVGGEEETHAARVMTRNAGFEPIVLKEPAQLSKRREQCLTREHLLEKPKGVDIGLAVRVLEDAYRNIYQECVIATSEVDFLPVIQAVQRLGKRVVVLGYRSGLGKNSDLDYVPDHFYDLADWVGAHYDVMWPNPDG